MKIILFAVLLSLIFPSNCGVFKSPNAGDVKYWHDYNIKFLKKMSNFQKPSTVAKNVILFVGDGMSFATIAAGRILKGQLQGKSGEETELIFEDFPYVSLSKTYNNDRQIPDSAATATAIFSGIKTSFFAVGLNNPTINAQESDRLKNIIDWAQENGKRTGLVTNTRITHATPAAAYAYSYQRFYECDARVPQNVKSANFKDIARQLVENQPGNKLNVIFGGGRDFFGAGDGQNSSCNRLDGENLVEKYLKNFNETDKAVKYVKNTEELRTIDLDEIDHLMGLFANDHMDYESVRKKEQPSLSEMTKAATKVLNNKKNQNGFVLIVEGGLIDQAHHYNYAKLALEEFIEIEKAVQVAKNLTSVEDTLIIVTADHSHSMVFHGYPVRGNDILGFANENTNVPLFETLMYSNGPGNKNKTTAKYSNDYDMSKAIIKLNEATHGGEDVATFADGPGSCMFQRVYEQCYIGYAISYASCIGPAAYLNELCSNDKDNSV